MSAPFSPSLTSILDTDLYKFTMQQAVLHHFPDVEATYRFTNRTKTTLFSRQSIERFRTAVSQFTDVSLTPEEHAFLQSTCPYFTPAYLSYLSTYRFKPEQVHITYVPLSADGLFGNVEIEAVGPWVETILWEVPLMAALSECYFQTVMTDWNYDGQRELAYEKGRVLTESGCTFSEFGTRRRRSYHAQDIVIEALVRASREVSGRGRLSGTSNVHFAHKYGIAPIGTIAHEWFMGVAALKGYEHTHSVSLDLWETVYHDSILIALTDTFTTDAFFKDFVADPERARRWTGLRQDSGDPFVFGPRVKAMYESLGIDPSEKLLVYSDALNVDKVVRLQKQADELGLAKVSFGIGTHLTNDFKTASSGGTEKSKALNMVIKLASVDGKPCVKISDDLTKNMGDKATIEHIKHVYHLEDLPIPTSN
ncbi:putative nicotinate phosphoribosyltransferase [Hypsizygus marmoreus]|uniref:Nicotinate phosphoribosyltransferase n=1 Tax=Hypsizygus marmoreus TaxID=39966 RepID=A0A369KAV3_HYPMA|nr:putative nicotinate phosphoribosyltransferase [Hypsizygus marmoreus]